MTPAATPLSPHPRSLLSFGCRVLASVEQAEVDFAPMDITPEALPPMSPWEAACLADANARYAVEVTLCLAEEISLAVDPGAEPSAALRERCARWAERRVQIAALLQCRQQPSPREIEVRMIVGGMMMQRGGRGASAAACRMLNQGIPTMATRAGRRSGFVRPTNVRHALNTMSRVKLELARGGLRCGQVLLLMMWQTMAVVRLWDQLRGAGAGVPTELTDRLCESGDILLLYRTAHEAIGERAMIPLAIGLAGRLLLAEAA